MFRVIQIVAAIPFLLFAAYLFVVVSYTLYDEAGIRGVAEYDENDA